MKQKHKILLLLLISCLATGCGKQTEKVLPMEMPETMVFLETSTSLTTETTAPLKQTTRKTSSERTETTVSGTTEFSSDSSGTVRKNQTSTTTVTEEEAQQEAETVIVYEYDDDGNEVTYYYYSYRNNSSGNSGRRKNTTTGKSGTTTTSGTTETLLESETSEETEETTELIPETEELTEPEPEPEPEPQPEILPKTGTVWEIMDMMTLEEKIYQLFIVTPEVLTGAGTVTAAGTATQNAIASQPVSGLIYFADNLVGWNQTSTMLSNTQSYARESGIGMFLAVDEEGGLVARCARKLGTTKFSPMATYGKDNDWNTAFWIGQTLGNDIGQFGFNLDFAPVADVNLNSGNELGTRIFSSDSYVVGNMVSGVVEGLQSTGVAATLKHFPGLGAENGNAHYDDKIIIDRTLDDLRNAEFIPFQYGIDAGADFVMVSHQIVTGAGDNLPACLSPVVCTDWLRNELGFEGILITDAFNMNTISGSYSPAESAVMAIGAGVDIILMPTDLTASVQGIETAVENGWISEDRINQSVERILLEKEKMNLLG